MSSSGGLLVRGAVYLRGWDQQHFLSLGFKKYATLAVPLDPSVTTQGEAQGFNQSFEGLGLGQGVGWDLTRLLITGFNV